MESFLERRVQTSMRMDPSYERSNLSFQNQRLRNNLSNRGKPIRREPDLVQWVICHVDNIGMTPQELSDRWWQFAARIAKVVDALPRQKAATR